MSAEAAGTAHVSRNRVALLHWLAIITLLGLIANALAWELFIAPGAGSALLALKALPLLMPLFGILRGRRYTYQWAPMLVLAYFVEGVMRGYADGGSVAGAAWTQAVLATAFILSAAYYARDQPRLAPPVTTA